MKNKIRFFFMLHWAKVVVGLLVLMAILWPIIMLWPVWSLSWPLDSYQRTYLMAVLSMTPIQSILAAAAFVYLYSYFLFGGRGFGGLTGLTGAAVTPEAVKVRWDEVIGIEEAKREAWEVVELLKDHSRLQQIGGKILRGILLIGPPGCGKTYLAKAIATEAGLPFLAVSGAEFNVVFMGTGGARMRSLFKRARVLAQVHGGCIVFIDELDAVGRSRSMDIGFGAQTDYNNTVNQLLVEMDGLKSQAHNIVVVGAMNQVEGVLDQALLRPGRFDRKIYVERPGLSDREALFRFYLGKVKADPSIDIPRLSRRTVRKSPADIENIVKEGALLATRNKRDQVTFKDLSEALERVDLGTRQYKKIMDEERQDTAYHEVGHLLAVYFLHPTDDVFKASIYMRRSTLGATWHVPREEYHAKTRDQYLAEIKVALAGYAAEKLKCKSTTSGVGDDFRRAISAAHEMVWSYGMGSNGFVGDYELLTGSWVFRGSATGDRLSDRVKEKLNEETHNILQACLKEVEELLRQEDVLLERFKDELLKHNELEYDDIEAIFAEYGKKRPFPVPSPTTT